MARIIYSVLIFAIFAIAISAIVFIPPLFAAFG